MVTAALVKELRERSGAGMLDCKKALEASNGNIDAAIDWLRENGIAKAAKKGDRVAAEGLTKVVVQGDKAAIVEVNSETDFVAKNEQFLELIQTVATGILNANPSSLEEVLKVEIEGNSIEEVIINGTATIGEKLTLRRFKVIEKGAGQSFASYSHMGGRISTLLLLNGDNDEVAKQIAMHTAAEKPLFLNIDDVDSETIDKEKDMLSKEALNEGKPANIVEKMVEGRIRKYYEEVCLNEQSYVLDSDKKVKEAAKEASLEIVDFARFEVGEGIEKEEVDFAQEVAAQARV